METRFFFSFNVFASFPKQTFFLSCISHILSQFTILLSGKELMTIKKRPLENIMGKEQFHTFFYDVFFPTKDKHIVVCKCFWFWPIKNLLFSKELMTRTKKKVKTLWEKNNLITINTLFNNVFHPIKDIDLT